MKVLITRSREDGERLAKVLAERGIDSLLAPLLEIYIFAGPPLALAGVQAILATSANGIRAFAERSAERHLPVFAVGDATARLARNIGFTSVSTASGDVDTLAERVIDTVPADGGELLHVAGTKAAGDLGGRLGERGFRYRREVIYEARQAPALDPAAVEAIRAGGLDGILFYSPRTASIFVELADRAGIADDLGAVTAYCLSEAVARRLEGLAWRAIGVAKRPDQESILALLESAT